MRGVLSWPTGTSFKTLNLENKEDWYLHTLREVIEALMANPNCDKGAPELGKVLQKVNRIQRGKPWRTSAYQ